MKDFKYYIEQKEFVHIENHLDLNGCTNLTSLGSLKSVGGYLDLQGCTNLTSLGSLEKVGGFLNLEGCTNLTSLGSLEKTNAIYNASKELRKKYKGKFNFK
jgi:hypothetical protein